MDKNKKIILLTVFAQVMLGISYIDTKSLVMAGFFMVSLVLNILIYIDMFREKKKKK